ncbi:hypothetical protein N7G274_004280 [Stereocaulon virgatum]|uniref:Uncharacterized protein n=1 Tax=Stereocaulon virgatum TaxID=373712 RepID=A0ABR4ABS6_9LECA
MTSRSDPGAWAVQTTFPSSKHTLVTGASTLADLTEPSARPSCSSPNPPKAHPDPSTSLGRDRSSERSCGSIEHVRINDPQELVYRCSEGAETRVIAVSRKSVNRVGK